MDSTPIPHCGNCQLRDSIPIQFDHLKSRPRTSRKGVRKLNPPRVHNEADDGCDFHLQLKLACRSRVHKSLWMALLLKDCRMNEWCLL
ncbi:hypothetical protein CDAR_605221 [Caerostris darwini]|uniref:Uncharacterized protein n=1 Tax=Caerostris darwini TaxID=1538125 RepID=A0AAV4U8S5_9ARAC|nr:hypothetical protein CDAR_605221 [Caerostris darwini]